MGCRPVSATRVSSAQQLSVLFLELTGKKTAQYVTRWCVLSGMREYLGNTSESRRTRECGLQGWILPGEVIDPSCGLLAKNSGF